jgi:16S rRNA (uracil1498-N3)-methyltransferase
VRFGTEKGIEAFPMRRFFVQDIKPHDHTLAITGSEARHISKVLRLGQGDRIVLMDRKGARFQAVIASAGEKEVSVILEKALGQPPASPVEITLCQALLKSKGMDYVVQKASELGVDSILPFSSERTVVGPGKGQGTNKLRHWREIARNAAKQADRARPAEVGPIYTFGDLLARWKNEAGLKIILWEGEETRDLKTFLRSSRPEQRVVGAIGPEGGFSPQEIEAAWEAGFVPASLGFRVLRSETAAVAFAAIIQYEWGDLSLEAQGIRQKTEKTFITEARKGENTKN